MKNIKEILRYMNGANVDGEDGGMVICALEELSGKEGLSETIHLDLGQVKHYGLTQEHTFLNKRNSKPSRLDLRVFENKDYKFICIEDTEMEVSMGGTCYCGSVEVYINHKEGS